MVPPTKHGVAEYSYLVTALANDKADRGKNRDCAPPTDAINFVAQTAEGCRYVVLECFRTKHHEGDSRSRLPWKEE